MTPRLFDRETFLPSAREAAPLLLGHFLWRRLEDGWAGGLIVEVEAYLEDDPACHAYRRRTARNAAMWGPPGRAYVYLIYGFHHCINVVCRPTGRAEAVLIRALEPAGEVDALRRRRPVPRDWELANGPGKLCAALDISREQDHTDLCHPDSPVVLGRNPERQAYLESRGPLVQTTRIGITRAADWPLRWYLAGSPCVSRRAPAGNRAPSPKPQTAKLPQS